MSTRSKGKGRRSSHSSSDRQRADREHRSTEHHDAQRAVSHQATQPRKIPGGEVSTLESIAEGSPPGTLQSRTNYTFSSDLAGITSQMGNTYLNRSKPDGRLIATRDARFNSEQSFGQEYKKHHSNEFKIGKVLKMIWVEPMGVTSGSRTSDQTFITQEEKDEDKYGPMKFEKARRFVIIAVFNGHCISLPISTYNGQGTLKYGVHAADHAMIYTASKQGTAPDITQEEYNKGLIRNAIRMDPVHPRDKLDAASRINFAKLYTIEHNVKVRFIGKIRESHLQNLLMEYKSVHQGHAAPEANWDQRETGAPTVGSWVNSGASSNSNQPSQSGLYSCAQGQQQQHNSTYGSSQYPPPTNFGASSNMPESYAANIITSRHTQPSTSTNYYNTGNPAYPSSSSGGYNQGYPSQRHGYGYSQAQLPEPLYTRSFRLEEPAPASYSDHHLQYQQLPYNAQGYQQSQAPMYPASNDPDELHRGS